MAGKCRRKTANIGHALKETGRARVKLGRVLVINPFNVLADKPPHVKSREYNSLDAKLLKKLTS